MADDAFGGRGPGGCSTAVGTALGRHDALVPDVREVAA